MKRRFRNRVRDLWIGYTPFFQRKTGPRVLCFHDIQDKSNFKTRMIWLKDNFNIVPIEDVYTTDKENPVAISFDDGYKSWISNVLPVILELEIPVCFFVNSGLLGLERNEGRAFLKEKVRRKETFLDVLSKDDLISLSAHNVVSIGGHTKDHCDFSQSHSQEVLKEQIVSDKQTLEEIIKKPIHVFAYPFGQLVNAPREVQNLVKQAGYKAAFTIIPGFRNDNNYLNHRDSLELWQNTRIWNRWLHGAYDSLVKSKLKLKGEL